MKNIDSFIIEKLHINKNTKIEHNIIDNYNVDDICLLFVHYDDRNGKRYNMIDVVQITDIDDKSCTFKYLTKTSEKNKSISARHLVYDKFQIEKYLYFTKTDSTSYMLIPKTNGQEIVNEIIKNKQRISWYSVLNGNDLRTGEYVLMRDDTRNGVLVIIDDKNLNDINDKIQ